MIIKPRELIFAAVVIIILIAVNVWNAFAYEQRWVRTTYYDLQGVMYNGEWVHHGAAACSWDMPLGTVIVFEDGREVVCKDRGHLGWSGWVDVWSPWHPGYDSWEVVEVWE